ncbi:MAG TPA: PAS domain S-box protein [Clostridia bacterium]|nr:PAS domain S-box protein [Clostridia bacterium]
MEPHSPKRAINKDKTAETANKARQHEALARLSHHALQNSNLASVLDDAVSLVAETLQVPFCDVLEKIPGEPEFLLRAGFGWRDGYVGSAKVSAGRESQAGYTFQTGFEAIVDEAHEGSTFTPSQLLLEHGVVSGITVLVPGRERPYSVLGAHTATSRTFTQEDINFLQAVANVLANAVQHARNEEVIRQRESYFRGLLEFAPDGIAIVDAEGKIRLVNRELERQFGYSREELVGQGIEVLVPAQYRSLHSAQRNDFAKERRARPMGIGMELVGRRKDGSEFPVEISLSPMQTPEGMVVTAAVRDVTERKQAEAQIKKLNSQLEEALRRSDRLATTGRMAASIAHEINNPLESLTGAMFLLDTEALTPRQRELVSIAQQELNRLTYVTRQTLAPHREPASPVTVNVSELLDAACASFSHQLDKLRIKVVREYDREAHVSVYPGELRQVFTNLISNAIDAMSAGGRLDLQVHKLGTAVQIRVGDTGHGIAADSMPNIFQPFFTTKGENGLGVGLWISRKIIEKLGGNIEVTSLTSGDKKGTWFTITLTAGGRETQSDATAREHQIG